MIERPAVLRQILDHLGLPTTAPSLYAPANQPREWSCEPLFEELPIPDPALV